MLSRPDAEAEILPSVKIEHQRQHIVIAHPPVGRAAGKRSIEVGVRRRRLPRGLYEGYRAEKSWWHMVATGEGRAGPLTRSVNRPTRRATGGPHAELGAQPWSAP